MGEVNIPEFSQTTDEGVIWTAVWDEKGNISYRGTDKDGNAVSGEPPSGIVKAAKDYSAGYKGAEAQNSENKSEVKTDEKENSGSEDSKKGENKKYKKGQNIAAQGDDGKIEKPEQGGNVHLFKKLHEKYGANSFGYNPKTGEISAYFRDYKARGFLGLGRKRTEIPLSEKDKASLRKYFEDLDSCRKADNSKLKPLAKGSIRNLGAEFKQTWQEIKEDGYLAIVRPVKDLYKAGKLIGKGKFRELRDRAALRVHDNLSVLGVLSDKTQSRLEAANERIEERLGIKNRDRRPGVVARTHGKSIKVYSQMFDRLRGRGNNQAIPVVARSRDRSRGNNGR